MHGANPKKVENQLKGNGLKLDKDGGDTLHVNISAKHRMHLDKLEEAILFQADGLKS
jgi:translation initiation factor IF-2